MRRIAMFASFMACLNSAEATEISASQLHDQINATIIGDPTGKPFAERLNLMMNNLVDSVGVLQSNNVWTGANSFSSLPVFSTCAGYLYGNGTSAPTCTMTIPVGSVVNGATPLLGAANIWAQAQTLSAAPIFSSLTGYVYANGAGALTAATTIPASALTGLSVATNADLKAFSISGKPNDYEIRREGFNAPGDGGEAIYHLSTSGNCAAANDGTQVQPTVGTGCWIANIDNQFVTPKLFGAVGDGVTDDTAIVQKASTALGNSRTLYTGPYIYGISSTITLNSHLKDEGGGQGNTNTTCRNGFRALADIKLFTPGFTGVRISTCADMAAAVTSTQGFIDYTGSNSVTVEDSQINKFCTGVSISGTPAANNLFSGVFRSIIVPRNDASCAGILVGKNSANGHTGDFRAENNFVFCANTAGTQIGMGYYDGGGVYFTNNEIFGCGYGTVVKPGIVSANPQMALYGFWSNTILGDTSSTNNLLIDTADVTARIFNLHFGSGSWVSAALGGDSVLIQNTAASPSVDGIQFLGVRNYIASTTANGFNLVAGKGISIKNSEICSYVAATGAGITVGSGVLSASILGNRVGQCDATTGSLATGIDVPVAGAANLTIADNDLTQATSPLNVADGASQNFTIHDNLGVNNLSPNLASAASVTLGPYDKYIVTGTTNISTVVGRWNMRPVTLISNNASPPSLVSGGTAGQTMCLASTPLKQFAAMTIYYHAGLGCWYAQSAVVTSRLKLSDQGQCTMAAGACAAQSLGSTYAVAPLCFLTWTGTGALAGHLKVASTTTTVTPTSDNGADTAQVNWVCFGN